MQTLLICRVMALSSMDGNKALAYTARQENKSIVFGLLHIT